MELNQALGMHWLIDFYNCHSASVNDEKLVRDIMMDAAAKSGATVVTASFHAFSPHGISGVVVVSESHFAIHTWPEHHFASVDIFTCGNLINIETAIQILQEAFKADTFELRKIERGTDLNIMKNQESNNESL